MRIDKYLWCVRIFKTRNIAIEYCKKNKIEVNGLVVKPSKEVVAGEKISVKKNAISFEYEVIQIPPNRVGAKLVSLYVKDKTPIESIERMKEINETQSYYRQKGVGRPTKKDRRDIDDFIWDFEE